jgi:di/tricarboxylate transporter
MLEEHNHHLIHSFWLLRKSSILHTLSDSGGLLVGWQGWLSLALTIGALAVLTLTRIGPHLVMMGVLTVLSVSGVLSAGEALAGFGNSGLITVAAMFVVAAGIYGSGGADWLVVRVLGQPNSLRSALSRIFAPVLLLSGFLNNTPVVAAMIPAIHAWARKINVPPSKLMIPLSYTAILGGTLTLIGTSTNLVVNGQYQALTGNEGFSLFAITPVGLPVALAGLCFVWVFSPDGCRIAAKRKRSVTCANSPSKSASLTMARWSGRPFSRRDCAI